MGKAFQGDAYDPKTKKHVAVNTVTPAVYDPDRKQALFASLRNIVERNALGYPQFVTTKAWEDGEVCFNDRKLWKFTADHAAGTDWSGEDVTEFGIKEMLDDIETTLGTKVSYNILTALLDEYAKKNGYYESLVAGKSENFVGEPLPVTTGYTLKATGFDPTQPELEFADGQVNMTEIRGRACAWNQLINNGNNIVSGTCSTTLYYTSMRSSGNILPQSHKMYIALYVDCSQVQNFNRISYNVSASGHQNYLNGSANIQKGRISLIITPSYDNSGIIFYCSKTGVDGNADPYSTKNFNIIDLTIENPALAAKANLTVEEVEAYLASVKTPRPYYKTNTGQLLGARMMGWQLRKTANLLNPTTKQALLFNYNYTGHNNEYTVNGWDELTNAALQFTPYNTGVAEAVTLDANNRFVIPSAGILEVVADGGDITGDISKVCVVATWDGSKDGEIVAYEQDNVQIDSANIYYDNNGVKTQVFENGIMRSTGDSPTDVHDRVYFDSIKKKWRSEQPVGSVDLGNQLWDNITFTNNEKGFTTILNNGLNGYTLNKVMICSKYAVATSYGSDMDQGDKKLWRRQQVDTCKIFVHDSQYSSAADFKAAMPGVKLFYGLKTPITHDTLYYKVGNEYLPMEEVFPNGIQGLCCNWASENLVEQEDDANGQPQSITPVTTEVFQSDYKELLKTIGDTYISRETMKSQLQVQAEAMVTAGLISSYTISDPEEGSDVYGIEYVVEEQTSDSSE